MTQKNQWARIGQIFAQSNRILKAFGIAKKPSQEIRNLRKFKQAEKVLEKVLKILKGFA